LSGAFAGRLLFRPFYSSLGRVWIQAPPSQTNGRVALPQQAQLLPIVAAALTSARQDPVGKSLPNSAAEALRYSTFAQGRNDDLVSISYADADPQAAACMARELVRAYTNALVSSNSSTGVSVTVIEQPTARNSARNGFPLLGGFLGAFVGVALALACVLFRIIWPKQLKGSTAASSAAW
jgi:hypothetical protein